MLVENDYSRNYLLTALAAGPDLVASALEGLTDAEADARPDPDRFNIREAVAHLAEWDPIFLGRMKRMVVEDHPTMPGYDEGQLAIEHHYELTNPVEQATLFRERRIETLAFLMSLTPDQWNRTGNRPEIGIMTVEAIATLMPLHDTYHLKQIIEWRKATG